MLADMLKALATGKTGYKCVNITLAACQFIVTCYQQLKHDNHVLKNVTTKNVSHIQNRL